MPPLISLPPCAQGHLTRASRRGACRGGSHSACACLAKLLQLACKHTYPAHPHPCTPHPLCADAVALAYHAARPLALRLLRALCQASRAAARGMQEAGLVRHAYPPLLRAAVAGEGSPGAGAAAAAAAHDPAQHQQQHQQQQQEAGALTEALRLWRCYAMHRFYLLTMDDAFPAICTRLAPAAAAPPGAWAVAREAYLTASQLCWHAARSGARAGRRGVRVRARKWGAGWGGQLPRCSGTSPAPCTAAPPLTVSLPARMQL